MNYFTKAIGALRRGGPFALIKKGIPFIYNRHIAPFLPRVNAEYNGVDVNAGRWFDSFLPWRMKNKPNYESGIILGIEEYVEEGDSFVIVGGGWGVSAVKAAQKVGPSGQITVYEGSLKQVKNVNETVKINNVSDRVEIIHGIVGPNISLRGESRDATQFSSEELPNCDVLELDCEGSEISILENLNIRPRLIIVESHGMNDAPSSKIENLLGDLSYSVKVNKVADEDQRKYCKENDIYTLTALRE